MIVQTFGKTFPDIIVKSRILHTRSVAVQCVRRFKRICHSINILNIFTERMQFNFLYFVFAVHKIVQSQSMKTARNNKHFTVSFSRFQNILCHILFTDNTAVLYHIFLGCILSDKITVSVHLCDKVLRSAVKRVRFKISLPKLIEIPYTCFFANRLKKFILG